MQMPTFNRGFGPSSARAVNAAEKRLGVRLSADYKRFLCVTNGGCPEPQEFVVPDRGPALAAILYGVRGDRIPRYFSPLTALEHLGPKAEPIVPDMEVMAKALKEGSGDFALALEKLAPERLPEWVEMVCQPLRAAKATRPQQLNIPLTSDRSRCSARSAIRTR